jgi:hypothetical protein
MGHLRCGSLKPTVPPDTTGSWHVIGCSGHDVEVDLDETAESLYGLEPEEFTAARDQAVRDATDADLKKALKALRRPTASAHAVNRLARDRGDDIDSLIALGDDMRTAMGSDPQRVRKLTEERRALIANLVDADLTAAVQQDVTATLEAATADPNLGAAVRSGRLVKPLRYAGFGALPDLSDAVATPLPAAGGIRRKTVKQTAPTTKKPAAKKAAGRGPAMSKTETTKRTAEPAPDLSEARQRCLELAGIADDAQRRYEEAARAAAEARTLLDRAEKIRAEAHRAARAAHQDAERARRELGRLERR